MIRNLQTSAHIPSISISRSHLLNPNPPLITFPPSNHTKSSAITTSSATRRISPPLLRKPSLLDQFMLTPRSKAKTWASGADSSSAAGENAEKKKNFWAAISLIIGTAVGPGMLGLPAATIKSGSLPSTIAILLSWIYVISSILLVAELSFAAMEEDVVDEVSFTGLATKAFGNHFAVLVSLVYASLSFSLMVACVSGIGSLVSQWFPFLNFVLAHALFPFASGCIIYFLPFAAIDSANRMLCILMLCSITMLVGIGFSVARANVLNSFEFASWKISSILPAIPVTLLTLGFHVVTPFICKLVSSSVGDACKAVLIGGSVPLAMVLSWNLIVLGLVGSGRSLTADPISLLLSVRSSALFAVQGFAFSALATSFIGYALSLPKQLADTLDLIKTTVGSNSELKNTSGLGGVGAFVLPALFVVPVLVATFFQSPFSKALDFAGLYANCFLFGVLPPLMAYIDKLKKKKRRTSILPGGDATLFLLFSIAVVLGIWH